MPINEDQYADVPWGKRFSGLTRRRWLQNTGLVIAAGTFSRVTAWAAAEISPVMEKLSTYMAEARNRELPPKALQETEHHILDTGAATDSGADHLPGREAIQVAHSDHGDKIAHVDSV